MQAVVDTVLEGWTRAFADRAAAVQACVKLGHGLEPSGQSRQLDDIHALAYPPGGPPRPLGYPDYAHLERAVNAKRALGLPVSAAAARDGIDARFWQAAPSACKPAH